MIIAVVKQGAEVFSAFCKLICFTCWWSAIFFVDLDTGFLPLPDNSWVIFHVVVYSPLESAILKVFHLFVQHGCMLRLICRIHSDWN